MAVDQPADQPMSRDEESALVSDVVRGDAQALNRFHDLLFEPLWRYVYYRAGGVRQDCEEIVQQTFLAALESLPRFRGDSSLFTWTCAIAKRRISKIRRRQSRERIAMALEQVDPEIERYLSKLESEPLPDEILERAETEDLVGATMASLPPHYQEVLVDKYVDAQPVAEIAKRQQTSEKSVESRLSRARAAFRHAFELLHRRWGGGASGA